MLKENNRDIFLFSSRFLKQRDYWTKKLSGEFDITDILFEYDKNHPHGTGKGKIDILFPTELGSQVIKSCKGSDLSIYILLLAALKTLIFRYTFNEDIIILSPINNLRVTEETLNTLLFIRDQLGSTLTFKEVVLGVRQSVLEAHENQDYPYDKLMEFLFPSPVEQDKKKKMPSNILCSLENLHDSANIEIIDVRFSFHFKRENDRLSGFVLYHSNTSSESETVQFSNHFVQLLASALRDVNAEISAIPFLTEEEKKHLLEDFNDNRADFPRDKTIYHFVEETAEKSPDTVAIGFMAEKITYRQLNREANRLAGVLCSYGVGEDRTVGILLERSPQMVKSILAIWKAGGAYIPLDVDYPEQRIQEILNDSQTRLLITMSEYEKTAFRTSWEGIILNPDEKIEGLARGDSKERLVLKINMNSLSYVIYTSGSTGKPKGAMVEHVGMMNHIAAKIHDLQLTGESIVAQNASHTFDISVWQFFAAFTLGGKILIYPDEVVLEPDRLISHVMEDCVTVLEVVPSYLSMMLEYLDSNSRHLDSLDYLLVTGETVKAPLVNQWFGKYPGIKMVNAYGPTEASDDITHFVMEKPPEGDRIPIGQPVQNFNIYIVDKYMNLCPIGVIGEIWVSGVGVGRGYLNDEDKTQKTFIRDPFIGVGETRLYKTGDLGRWLTDGTIEFFGRKDHQVKMRGFRIELEEIENQLLRMETVKEAVVVARGEDNNRYLCAYIVPHTLSELTASDVRDYLSASLPYYMIPSYFLFLAKPPLTPNGKIDRKALPDPEITEGDAPEYIAPRNEVEEKLAEIWADVLELQGSIGIDDNFFELGGHSLRATLMAAKIYKELNVKLSLAKIFKNPTIRGLSENVKGLAKDNFVSIEPAEEKEYYALSSAQRRLFVIYRMDQNSINYNMSTIVELEGTLQHQRLEETFGKLIQRHESFRTSFEMIDKEPVQKVHNAVDFEIEYYSIEHGEPGGSPIEGSTGSTDTPPATIIKTFIRPFDLTHAPLLRVGVIRTGQFNHLLMADMHHIISDGVSLELLIKEFTIIYAGNDASFLKLQYKDYSEWQYSPGVRAAIQQQEKYWLKEFENDAPELNIPIDYPRPAVRGFDGDSVGFTIDKEETRGLKALALKEEATLFMVLLAIYNVLLSKLSGGEDIVVGTGIAGRRHENLQRIVGMFVNTLALRSYPGREKTFKAFLSEIKEKTLLAFENQDYQFEDLAEKVVPNRDWSRNPLFDTAIVYEKPDAGSSGIPEVEFAGLTVKPYRSEHKVSRFDMTFFITDMEEQLEIGVEYAASLFKKETINMFIDYFKEVVTTVLTDNEILLGDITFTPYMREADTEVPKYEFKF